MDLKAFPVYKEAEYWSEILEEECSLLEWRALEYDGTNDLFRLKVTTDAKTHHAIVKAAKSEDPDYNYAPDQLKFFISQELYFYKLVAPFISETLEITMPIPQLYGGSEEDGWIAVEDLSFRGYEVPFPKHFNKFELSQLPPMLSALAKFHANCKGCEIDWQNKFPEMFASIDTFLNLWWEKVPQALNMIRDGLKNLTIGDHLQMTLMKDWVQEDLVRAQAWFDSHIESFDNLSDLQQMYYETVKSDTVWGVVCSNDYWNQNVMYNLDEIPPCMMIDWELMHFGSSAFDVLNCLVDSLNQDVWCGNMDELLLQYHGYFMEQLKSLETKLDLSTFSIDSFKLEIRRMILPLFLRQTAWQVAFSDPEMAVEYSLTLCNNLARCFEI